MGLLTAPLSLVRVPLLLTLRLWQFGLSTAAEGARIGMELLDTDREQPAGADGGAPGAATDVEPVAPEPAVVTPETDYVAPEPGEAGPGPDVLDVAAAEAATGDAPPPAPDELIPDHVDEEPVLVAEVAEGGAEDGAGPELHVDPPWDGYDRMSAAEIRDRLVAATGAEAAAVELYESVRKSRRSVLDAAERALRRQPARRSPSG
jgi:hypothetical protein